LLESPLALALCLLTAYYALVAVLHRARSMKSDPALVGAALFASLTTVATVWPRTGI
jgi:hypothetical protein